MKAVLLGRANMRRMFAAEYVWNVLVSSIPPPFPLFVSCNAALVYIVINPCWLCADDLKLVVRTADEVGAQVYVDAFADWATSFNLPFNEDERRHLAVASPETRFRVSGEQRALHGIAHCSVACDLGIQISADIKQALQCSAAAAKVSHALLKLEAAVFCEEVEFLIPLHCFFCETSLRTLLMSMGSHFEVGYHPSWEASVAGQQDSERCEGHDLSGTPEVLRLVLLRKGKVAWGPDGDFPYYPWKPR